MQQRALISSKSVIATVVAILLLIIFASTGVTFAYAQAGNSISTSASKQYEKYLDLNGKIVTFRAVINSLIKVFRLYDESALWNNYQIWGDTKTNTVVIVYPPSKIPGFIVQASKSIFSRNNVEITLIQPYVDKNYMFELTSLYDLLLALERLDALQAINALKGDVIKDGNEKYYPPLPLLIVLRPKTYNISSLANVIAQAVYTSTHKKRFEIPPVIYPFIKNIVIRSIITKENTRYLCYYNRRLDSDISVKDLIYYSDIRDAFRSSLVKVIKKIVDKEFRSKGITVEHIENVVRMQLEKLKQSSLDYVTHLMCDILYDEIRQKLPNNTKIVNETCDTSGSYANIEYKDSINKVVKKAISELQSIITNESSDLALTFFVSGAFAVSFTYNISLTIYIGSNIGTTVQLGDIGFTIFAFRIYDLDENITNRMLRNIKVRLNYCNYTAEVDMLNVMRNNAKNAIIVIGTCNIDEKLDEKYGKLLYNMIIHRIMIGLAMVVLRGSLANQFYCIIAHGGACQYLSRCQNVVYPGTYQLYKINNEAVAQLYNAVSRLLRGQSKDAINALKDLERELKKSINTTLFVADRVSLPVIKVSASLAKLDSVIRGIAWDLAGFVVFGDMKPKLDTNIYLLHQVLRVVGDAAASTLEVKSIQLSAPRSKGKYTTLVKLCPTCPDYIKITSIKRDNSVEYNISFVQEIPRMRLNGATIEIKNGNIIVKGNANYTGSSINRYVSAITRPFYIAARIANYSLVGILLPGSMPTGSVIADFEYNHLISAFNVKNKPSQYYIGILKLFANVTLCVEYYVNSSEGNSTVRKINRICENIAKTVSYDVSIGLYIYKSELSVHEVDSSLNKTLISWKVSIGFGNIVVKESVKVLKGKIQNRIVRNGKIEPLLIAYAGPAFYTGLGLPSYILGALSDMGVVSGLRNNTAGVIVNIANRILGILSYLGIPGYIVPGMPLSKEGSLYNTSVYLMKGEYFGIVLFEGYRFSFVREYSDIYDMLVTSEAFAPTLLSIAFEGINISCTPGACYAVKLGSSGKVILSKFNSTMQCSLAIGIGLLPELGAAVYSLPSRPTIPQLSGVYYAAVPAKGEAVKNTLRSAVIRMLLGVANTLANKILCAEDLASLRVNLLSYIMVYKSRGRVGLSTVVSPRFIEISGANTALRFIALKDGNITIRRTLVYIMIKKVPFVSIPIPIPIIIDYNDKIAEIKLNVIEPSRDMKIIPLLVYKKDRKYYIISAVAIDKNGPERLRTLLIGSVYHQLYAYSRVYPTVLHFKIALYDPVSKSIVGKPANVTIFGISEPLEVDINKLHSGIYRLALVSEEGNVFVCKDPLCTVYVYKPELQIWSIRANKGSVSLRGQIVYVLGGENAVYTLSNRRASLAFHFNRMFNVSEAIYEVSKKIVGLAIDYALARLENKLEQLSGSKLNTSRPIGIVISLIANMSNSLKGSGVDCDNSLVERLAQRAIDTAKEILESEAKRLIDEIVKMAIARMTLYLSETVIKAVLPELPLTLLNYLYIESMGSTSINAKTVARDLLAGLALDIGYKVGFETASVLLQCLISSSSERLRSMAYASLASTIDYMLKSEAGRLLIKTLYSKGEKASATVYAILAPLSIANGYVPIISSILLDGKEVTSLFGVVNVNVSKDSWLTIAAYPLESYILQVFMPVLSSIVPDFKRVRYYQIVLAGMVEFMQYVFGTISYASNVADTLAKGLGIGNTYDKYVSRIALKVESVGNKIMPVLETLADMFGEYHVIHVDVEKIYTLPGVHLDVLRNVTLAPALNMFGVLIDLHDVTREGNIRIIPGIHLFPPVPVDLREILGSD